MNRCGGMTEMVLTAELPAVPQNAAPLRKDDRAFRA